MKKCFWPTVSASLIALTFSSQAMAATSLSVDTHVSNSNFINPLTPPADVQFHLTGTIDFYDTLSDGSYDASDISNFSLNLQFLFHPAASVPGFYATADYAFTKANLTDFGITYSGGAPVSAFWTTSLVDSYAHSHDFFNPVAASVDFMTGPDDDKRVSYYLLINDTKTLVAQSDLNADLYERSAVPEPASWAMMITGFAMVGASVRRRNIRRTYKFA